jgi:hypothetical protein
MEKIFEIATHISTPLALAGLFAAVLFFVFRQILLTRNKELSKQQYKQEAVARNKIVLAIINRLFVLALISTLLGFTGWTIQTIYKPKTTDNIAIVKINVYVDNKPVNGVSVTADNVRENRTTDIFGMVNLTFDNASHIDSLHLYFKSDEYHIESSMMVPYKSVYSFNFPSRTKTKEQDEGQTLKPKNENNQVDNKEVIKYIGEFDMRLAQMKRFLILIDSTKDESQKSYFSNGIRAAFNGAKGWYQPTYPEFQEVPFFTIVQWFRINGINNKFSNEILLSIQNEPSLEENGIYVHDKTLSFLKSLDKYRRQFNKY